MGCNGAKWATAVAAVWIGISGCGDEPGDAVETSTTGDTGASESGTTIDDDLGESSGVSSGEETGDQDTDSSDGTHEAVVWETTLAVDPDAGALTVHEIATSPTGRTYALVSGSESGPVLFALSPEGEALWSHPFSSGDLEGTDLVATEDHVVVGVVTNLGSFDRAYRYTVINNDGSVHSTAGGETDSDSIGLALAGENLILAISGPTEISGSTTSGALVRAYRLGTTSPAWSWTRPGADGSSLGNAAVILPDGGIAVAGRSADPGGFLVNHCWVGRLSASGQSEWDVHLDLNASAVTLTLGNGGNLHVTARETDLVVGTDGQPINVVSLDETFQSSGGVTRLSWSSTGFLVGGRLATGDAGVSGYSTSGDSLWQYGVGSLQSTRASFVDDASFVLAGSAIESDAVLVQRLDTNLL